jgi:hypothetical protein
MTTATMTRKAARLVEQEERAARSAKVRATAQRLQVEATKAAAAGERQRKLKAADEAVSKFMHQAPVATLTYGEVTVTIRYIGRDAQQTLTISEAVRRAERVLHQAFTARLGQVRTAAMNGTKALADVDIDKLVEILRYELNPAARLGAVTIEGAK